MADLTWNTKGPSGSAGFAPGFQTDWVVVLTAGGDASGAAEAMDKLCRAYWYPLYAYVRRQGHSPQVAQDLTQEFFARLLQKAWLHNVHPSKGKFRSFLLASMNHFLANEWRKSQTQKRGGGCEVFSLDAVAAEGRYQLEPAHDESPDKLFERRWATLLLERAVARLEEEYWASNRGELFSELKGMLDGQESRFGYAEVALKLGTTETALKKAVQRLRERYRDLLREEVAQTLTAAEDIEEEIHYLFSVFRDQDGPPPQLPNQALETNLSRG